MCDDNGKSRHMMGHMRHMRHMPGQTEAALFGAGRGMCSERITDYWPREVMNKTGKIGNTAPNPASCRRH